MVPTPESDVRWHSTYVAEIGHGTPSKNAQQHLDSLISALAKVSDTNFWPGREAIKLICLALKRMDLDLDSEFDRYFQQFPGLERWSAYFDGILQHSDFAIYASDIKNQIAIARKSGDFALVRELTLRLLRRIPPMDEGKRQEQVTQIAGSFLEIDGISSSDIEQLRVCWTEFTNCLTSYPYSRQQSDTAKANENFIHLAKSFQSSELDAQIQMAACLRTFGRSDLALQVLDNQFPELGKFVNPHFENTLLATLMDLEQWTRAEALVTRLRNPGPVVLGNRARILPTIWRYHKEAFLRTGDLDELERIDATLEEMSREGVDFETLANCRAATSKLKGSSVSQDISAGSSTQDTSRKSAPSVAKVIEESGIGPEIEAWFSALPE